MSNTVDNRFMEFRLGAQLYAMPLLNVKEVISKPEITPVPNMPAHFEGMFNLRGQILGIFNIRKKMGLKAPAEGETQQGQVVIVIEKDGLNAGMIVDEVTRVLHADPNMVGPAPLKSDDPARKYVEAIIQTSGHLVPTLDVSALLELDKYKANMKAAG